MPQDAAARKCEDLRSDRRLLDAAACFEGMGLFPAACDCCLSALIDMPSHEYGPRIALCLRGEALAARAGDHSRRVTAFEQAASICEAWSRETDPAGGNTALEQAMRYRSKAGEAASAGRLWTWAARAFTTAAMHARMLERHESALALARRAIDAGLNMPAAEGAAVLSTAYDLAGRAIKSLDRDCAAAAASWKKAAEYAKQAEVSYRAPRCAWIDLSTEPDVIEVTGRDPTFVDQPMMYFFKDAALYRLGAQGPQAVDPRYLTRITARVSEPSGRVTNCIVTFHARKADGLVLPSQLRTNAQGEATTTFCATGKAGPSVIGARDKTGARASVTVTVAGAAAAGVDLRELRWIYPNSLGLDGTKPEAVHWRRQGVRPIAHVFGGRGLHGQGRTPKGLEIDLTLARGHDPLTDNASALRVEGTAVFTTHADSPEPLPPWQLEFRGDHEPLSDGEMHVRVFSDGTLPTEAVGHYQVRTTWRFQVRETGESAWRELPGAHVTVNDLYVTWKQPLPAVMARFDVSAGLEWPPVAIGHSYGKPLYEPGGDQRWYPRVYLECLRWSTRAIVAGGRLDTDGPAAQEPADEVRQEVELLDRIFDGACGAPPLARLGRIDALVIPSAPAPHYQASDIITGGNGNCGDWACLLHDLAAAQGVHVSLATLGASWSAENFCMYPTTDETTTRLPVVYGPFIGRGAGVNGHEEPRYGFRSTRDHAIFGDGGARAAYKAFLTGVLELKPEDVRFVTLWDPRGIRSCGCGAAFRDYRDPDPESDRDISVCPGCGAGLGR